MVIGIVLVALMYSRELPVGPRGIEGVSAGTQALESTLGRRKIGLVSAFCPQHSKALSVKSESLP